MSTRKFRGALRNFAGIGANTSGHLDKWVSGVGGIVSILGILLISQAYLGLSGGASVVASMGASAVLLFAVPHGPLSQPWAVFGGHIISAIIGVSCTHLNLGLTPIETSALAVGLAISAMYYLRCIHPPGGATALSAVAGGQAIYDMGYQYVLTPVLLNVMVILSIAILFNLPFSWRRYPVAWSRKAAKATVPENHEHLKNVFSSEELTTAAGAIDPGMGIGQDNLATIYTLAHCIKTESGSMNPDDIRVGAYYCNGKFGPHWQVRQVLDYQDAGNESSAEKMLSYRIVAGNNRRQTDVSSRETFAAWARYEVCLNESSWQRVNTTILCSEIVENAA